MKYIICEDEKSGYFFWQQINKVFFEGTCIVQARKGLPDLVKYIITVAGTENQYLVCFDNCTDNKELKNSVSVLRKLEREYDNIFLVQYICFEQVLVSSDRIQDFIPNIKNDIRRKAALEHIAYDFTDVQYLKDIAEKYNISKSYIGTTERFFRPIIEDNGIVYKGYITNPADGKQIEKLKMCHHYICKGSWSRCWYMDCEEGCPENHCWKTARDCVYCERKLNDPTCYESENSADIKRKYEEEEICNRKIYDIPLLQSERIRVLFKNSIIKDILL